MKNVTISTRKRLFSDDSMMALSMAGLRSSLDDSGGEAAFRSIKSRPASDVATPIPKVSTEFSVFLGLVLKDQLPLEQVGAAGDHDSASFNPDLTTTRSPASRPISMGEA